MKKIIKNCLAIACVLGINSHALFGALTYETYLESWDSGWNTAMTGMPPILSDASTTYNDVTLDIAFAAYVFPGLNGPQFSSDDAKTVINYVHSQNGKVKISFGGASYAAPYYPNYFISQTAGWPNNIPTLVTGVTQVVNDYQFDGVDFDIEDALPAGTTATEFADDLFNFLTQVRQSLPSKKISLTIPAQGWPTQEFPDGTYWELLAKKVAAANTVDCITFMEYDIWVGAASYEKQIEADIITYTSPTTTRPAPNNTDGWGIPARLVQLGLMPGNDDIGNFLSVSDAQYLTQFAIGQGLFGVVTWDLDRDAGTNPNPSLNGATPYAYSNAIRTALYTQPLTLQLMSSFPKKSVKGRHARRNRVPFVRQAPPPMGAPS